MRVYIIYTPSKRLNIKGVYYMNAMGLKVWPDFTTFFNQGEHKISSPSIQSIEVKADSMYEVIKYTSIRESR